MANIKQETKKKISDANRGRIKSLELRHRMSLIAKEKQINIGEKHGMTKLTNKKVTQIKNLYKRGWRNKDLAEKFNVSRSVIGYILTGRTWRHIE